VNLVDIMVVILLLVGLVSGARAGFPGPVLGLICAIGGFLLALVLTSVLREPLAAIEQPMRALVTLLGLGVLVLIGEAAGAAIGASMSRGNRLSVLRPLDALGGAVVGAAHVVLLVWLMGGLLSMGIAPSVGAMARDSVALRLSGELLPPPTAVAGGLLTMMDSTDLPPLFAGMEPPAAAPVTLPPDAETSALAQSAIASTAKITSTGCGAGLSIGSGFFVSATHAITNAHVVAGSGATSVTVGGTNRNAVVVAFDTESDLALLYVPGASAPSLQLSPQAPTRGTAAAALGFPGGGELTVTAAAVTATYEVPGPDIYGTGQFSRNVVEMNAAIRRGNSGGPLIIAPGLVGAVVFGASRVDPDVGYAIGSDEAVERIGPFIGSLAAVDTGACL